MAYSKDFLDAVAIVSFALGIANYEENLSQSDKDDLLNSFDKRTNELLLRLESDLEKQNEMLEEILSRLK